MSSGKNTARIVIKVKIILKVKIMADSFAIKMEAIPGRIPPGQN